MLRGRVWKFGDGVSGDDGIINFDVIRAQSFDPDLLAKICMWKYIPDFYKKAQKGDIIVGGKNFAHPSHTQVVEALKACGIGGIIAKSYTTGFIRKALNSGLPALTCPDCTEIVETGDVLEVDLVAGEIRNITNGSSSKTQALPKFMIDMLTAGGLVPFLKIELGSKNQVSSAS